MTHSLGSWGRYPLIPQSYESLYWRDETGQSLASFSSAKKSTLPYGNGRSYGDSCLAASNVVLLTRPLNRFISADWSRGIISAESGVTLEEILSLAIPRGWFLPVTPGTKFVTLGGAIANDVHGKNHHVRGTFGRHILQFDLVRSDLGTISCSPQRNSQYFEATIGGLGLTGIITRAELQLIPVRSSQITGMQIQFGNLSEFFRLSSELDPKHEYSVAWIDCLARGKNSGRGVLFVGDHAEEGPLEVSHKRNYKVPFTPPFSIINPLTLRIFNSFYYHSHKTSHVTQKIDYDPFFYPLDRIMEWNRIYGPRGFQQYQCVIPEPNAQEAIKRLLETISKSGNGSFLAVLKRTGNIPSPGILSFPMPGSSLALDFPEDVSHNAALFASLDAMMRDAGGRLYPAKDAHMKGSDFRRAYPGWERVEELRDPLLMSHFWQRVSKP